MADYYSILKKTISGLAHNSQGTRTAVYGKARSAIDRQLRAIEPTPSEEAIARQMGLLEEAIVKLDSEFSQQEIATPEPTPIPEQVELAPTPNHVEAEVAPEVSNTPAAAEASGYMPAGNDITDTVPTTNEAPSVDPQGMAYSETILAVEPDTRGGAAETKKSSVFSTLIPILLAIGVIGGGAYALWINKDALLDGLQGNDNPVITDNKDDNIVAEPVATDTEATDNNVALETDQGEERNVRVVGAEPEKSSSQLTETGETVEVAPVTPETPPVETVPAVDTPVVDTPVEPPVTPSATEEPQQVTEIGEDGSKTTSNETDTTQPEQPATQPSAIPAVAQKAFLYEEGSSGSDASRDNAAVIWSLGNESIDGSEPEAVIKGQLDVPGRNMVMNLVIKRNLDASLPASHIIELLFQLPKDFSGGNIANVSRFVMKTSEQARGEGLVAVPAKISDGNFLIALNNLDQALATNRKLLLGSSWIDVPLGYTTGRRALVTLEKGALGNKVFKDAFADWDKR